MFVLQEGGRLEERLQAGRWALHLALSQITRPFRTAYWTIAALFLTPSFSRTRVR